MRPAASRGGASPNTAPGGLAPTSSFAPLTAKRRALAALLAEKAPPDVYVLYPLQSETIRDGGDYALRDTGKLAAQLAVLAGIPWLLARAHDDYAAFSAPRVPLLGALWRLVSGRPRTAAQLQAWLATPGAWALIAATLCLAAAAHAALRSLHPRAGHVTRVSRVTAKAAAFYAAVWAVAGRQGAAVAILRQAFILSPVTALDLGRHFRAVLVCVMFCTRALSFYCSVFSFCPQPMRLFSGLDAAFSAVLLGEGGSFATLWVGSFARMYIITNVAASLWNAPLATAGWVASLSAAAAAAYAPCSTLLPDDGLVGLLLRYSNVDVWALASALASNEHVRTVRMFLFFSGQASLSSRLRERGATLLASVARLDKLLSVAFVASRYQGEIAVRTLRYAVEAAVVALIFLMLANAAKNSGDPGLGDFCMGVVVLTCFLGLVAILAPSFVFAWNVL